MRIVEILEYTKLSLKCMCNYKIIRFTLVKRFVGNDVQSFQEHLVYNVRLETFMQN